MQIYNSLTHRPEAFEPRDREVSLYVCGITPYDTTHLGHAFTYASADILVRLLELQGFEVHYVQNVTDIDDDILRKAREADEDWRSLGNRWTAHFIRDMQSLNIRAPDHYPRATEVIDGIIRSVRKLLEVSIAYEAGGNVYFDIDAWPEYGKLSRLPRQEMLPIANERGNNPDDPHKRNPLDFVLWQAQAPGEPAWESPWGPGRPGWHIECSTMATAFLGPVVDFHMGGADLIFPHHESEIAQVEPIMEEVEDQDPYVRYWLHTAMVRYQGEKMSKSLGNLVMVNDLLENFSPAALRLYLASHHYRQEWSYEAAGLEHARDLADRLDEAMQVTGGAGETLEASSRREVFIQAMQNDLDSPSAVRELDGLAGEILGSAGSGKRLEAAQATLGELAGILGVTPGLHAPETRVVAGWEEHLRKFR